MKRVFSFVFPLLYVFLLIPIDLKANSSKEGESEKISQKISILKKATPLLTINIPSLEIAARLALNQYPELKNSQIEVIEGNITTSMMAQPKMLSLFTNSKKNRKYRVIVNSNRESAKSNLIYELDLEGQVALLAHEFAHLLDYSTQSRMEMIGTGIAYSIVPNYRKETEHQADHEVIKRGLGEGLLQFTSHVFNHKRLSKKYKEYKKKYYLSPDEIASAVNPTP